MGRANRPIYHRPMTDPLRHARIRALLEQAERAHRIREELVAQKEGTDALDSALDSVFRDLGQALFERVQADRGPLIPPAMDEDPTQFTSELEREDTSWYDDVDVPDRLFDDDDLEDDVTDIPEPDPLPEPTAEAPEGERVTLAALQAEPIAPNASWGAALEEWLTLVDLPADLEDAGELAVEASKVQWAAQELERLDPFPAPVQLACIGLLAARAQHLRQHLDVGVGPKQVLDRLRRYGQARALPPLAASTLDPHPETGSWAGDARAFWSLLAGCAKPTG